MALARPCDGKDDVACVISANMAAKRFPLKYIGMAAAPPKPRVTSGLKQVPAPASATSALSKVAPKVAFKGTPTANGMCAAGIAWGGQICCAASCGECERGDKSCRDKPGGRDLCCASQIARRDRRCVTKEDVGCVI